MKNRMYYLGIILLVALIISSNLFSAAPTLLRPSNGGCVSVGDTLVWRAENNVLSYVVYVSSNSDMSDPILSKGGMITSFVPSDTTPSLFSGMTYYWQVRVYYNQPGQQDASAVWSFTTPPFPVTLNLPANAAICQSKTVTLSWFDNPGNSHNLQVSTSNTFGTNIYDLTGINENEKALTMPDYQTTYYWRVKKVSNPCSSDWSATRSFTTKMIAPTPVSPSNNSTGISELINFRWNATGTPSSHRIQAASDSLFADIIFDEFSTKNSYKGTIGTINRDIYWRVKSTYNSCETEWSEFYKFTAEFVQPVLVSPQKDSNCTPQLIRFEWQAMVGVTAYRLQVASDMNFTSLVVDKSKIAKVWDTLRVPLPFTYYYWRLKAEDDNVVGIWSETYSFKTGAPVPTRIFPANKDTVPITIDFQWNVISAGAKYRIQVSETPDYASPVLDQVVTDTILSFRLPTFYKKFYWRLSSEVLSCVSVWSSTWEFRTRGMAPTLDLPANKSVNQMIRPRFSWTKPEGAEKYSFQISKDLSFKNLVSSKSNLLYTTYVYDKNLEPLTEYFWRVLATSAQGSSAWSQAFSFTTGEKGPDNPQLIKPDNNSTGQQILVKFIWKSSPGAKKYQLLLDTNDNFQMPKIYNEITDTSYEVGGLSTSTVYYWMINAINDVGTSSSDIWKFRTVIDPPSDTAKQIAPVNNSRDLSIPLTLSWKSVQRADFYELELSTNSQFEKGTLILQDTNIAETMKYITSLPFGTQIYWRVRPRNESGKGPWTDPWTFSTMISSVENEELLKMFNVSVNPNPNNGSFTLNFDLKNPGAVITELMDITGRTIRTAKDLYNTSGIHAVSFSENNLADGLYFIRLRIDSREIYTQIIISK